MNKKTALVTGASRGIGREIALGLAREGMDITITYTSNEEMADDVLKEIQEYEVNAIAVKANVSIEEDVKNLVKEVEEKLGKIDVLVNNAGITKDNLLIKMSDKDFSDVLDVNLKGVFLCTKAVARSMMKKRYGKIINISSIVGVGGNAGQGNYAASKAGVIGFTKSIAKELGSRGIRVNVIAPGFIETQMTDVLKEDIKELMLSSISLKEFGKPSDISNLVNFLASDKSDYITGEVIKIDGGMSI